MAPRFFKTIIKVVVLTDDGPIDTAAEDEGMTLTEIDALITDGGGTGQWEVESSEELTSEQMKEELKAVGSSEEFFFEEED